MAEKKPVTDARRRQLEAELKRLFEEEAIVQAERSLSKFIRQSWHVVEPDAFLSNWHIDAICDHLEAVNRGEIRRLLINVPPRCMKSLTVSVFWPAWTWIGSPQKRWMFGSYDSELSTRDAVKTRDIIRSPWYQARWGGKFRLKSDQDVKTRYDNDKGGFRIATSVGGGGTGDGGDVIVADDPLSARDGDSDKKRDAAWLWWTRTMQSRQNNPKTGAMVVVMQRLHQEDVAGKILETGGYVHLCLPNEYEPKVQIQVTPLGWSDPRTNPGELLWPERIGSEETESLKGPQGLGSYAYAGQYQQRPSPAEGGAFKRKWWRYWHYPGSPLPPVPVQMPDGSIFLCPCVPLPERFDLQLQSWDLSFDDVDGSDYVVGQYWGRRVADKFLLDQVRDRMDAPTAARAIVAFTAKHPGAVAKLIEKKANGAAVLKLLKSLVSGLIPIEPIGSKWQRAKAVAPQVEGGNVYLPHPSIAPWVDAYVEEHAAFNKAPNDDQVDATTQALDRLLEDAWVAAGPIIHQVGETIVTIGEGPDPNLARPYSEPGYSILGGALAPFLAPQRRR
jgi:predicted phage terminase large subunit-like protein